MKQTAVEWLITHFKKLQLEEEKMSWNQIIQITELAKEMENQQRIDAIKNELKLIGNYFDVSKLEAKEQGHHIRFTSILKDRFDYYNKTHGGNK